MMNLGRVKPGRTIRIPWGSYTGSTGASSATTNYAAADILIYKDGGTTERASTAGFTATTTFDTLTGINLTVIDLADNTTAGFFAAGSEYLVIVGPVTIDTQTVNFPIARFMIGMDGAIHESTIATLASQTSFTLTTGPAEDGALTGCVAYIHDVASAVQCSTRAVTGYTGATLTVTLAAGPTFTAAVTDNIMFFPPSNVHTISGTVQTARDLGASVLVSSGTGAGQISLSSGAVLLQATQTGVTIPTVTTLTGLTAATVHSDLDDIQARLPAALVSGRIDASVGAMAAGVLTATAIAADAITDAKVASDVTIASVTGAVGSVTTVSDKTGYTLSATGSAALTESYAADAAAGTLPQLLYMILAVLTEASVSSTTLTAKKLDGSTTAATFTLSDATNPVSITRTT